MQNFTLTSLMTNTLNKLSDWSIFKTKFCPNASKIEKAFLHKYVQLDGQIFSSLLEKVAFNPQFWGIKCRYICFFGEKIILSELYQI